jgi:major membrane immunogen (membrane-anchored lipoprotein)
MAFILRRGTTMKNVKVLALLMVLILSVSVLAACSSKTPEVSAPAPAPVTETPAPAPVTETPAPPADALKDGVYNVSYDKADAHGWKATIQLEVKDAKIATVKFDYVNESGALKSQDAAYKAQMEPVAKTYPEKAFNELNAALVEKQDVAQVAAVTGATASSNDFLALAKAAVEAAKAGDTTAKTVPAPPQK